MKKQKNPPSEGEFRDKNCLRKNELAPLLAGPIPNVKTEFDYLPKILKQAKTADPKEPEWPKAVCPICAEEYKHPPDYRPETCSWKSPSTCGKFDCVYEFVIKKRGEK